MTDREDNFKPYYHPFYGWCWLDISYDDNIKAYNEFLESKKELEKPLGPKVKKLVYMSKSK